MSIINVEALIVQTMGFAVAIAWGGALDKYTKSIYVPDELKDLPEYKNASAVAKSGLVYAIITTLIIIAIVYLVNNAAYALEVVDPPVTVQRRTNTEYNTLASSGHGIDIVMNKK